MASKILYAKELFYDFPVSLSAGRNILVADTPDAAIRIINAESDSIDGFVLGGFMIKTDECVETAHKLYDMISQLDAKLHERKLVNRKDVQSVYNLLTDKLLDCRDVRGGKRVFYHLQENDYVGKKPLLRLTNLPLHGYFSGEMVKCAHASEGERAIKNWLKKNKL